LIETLIQIWIYAPVKEADPEGFEQQGFSFVFSPPVSSDG